MAPFLKGFGRRKSTANALEDLQITSPPGESSFKVLDRTAATHKPQSSFDGGIKLKKAVERPNTSPIQRDNMFAGINRDRDSGGSNSNTTSTFTTDNSSRFSAASTTPSTHNSAEYHRQDERVSHPERTYDIPPGKLPRAPSAFSLKAGGRTFSFGKGKGTPPLLKEEVLPPPLPIVDYENMGAGRSRGTTTSSHASTTVPPKLEDQDLGLNLGGDFSADMFSNYKRKSATLPNEGSKPLRSAERNIVAEPAKPLPAYSTNRSNHPPPLTIDRSRHVAEPPYSWTSHDSGSGLMAATPSPPPVAHMSSAPPVPPHGMPRDNYGDNFASHARPQRPGAPVDSSLRRSSNYGGLQRQSTFEVHDSVDEDAKLLRESYHASRQLTDSYGFSKENYQNQRPSPTEALPKQQMRHASPVSSQDESEDMFDPSIAEHAILANQLSERALSPPRQRLMPTNKVMTPAQFERAKQDHDRAILSKVATSAKDTDDDDESDNYDEDEDEAERLKNVAKQRKLQDAHMAVFRQGMMKSTGETASPMPNRPHMMPSYSTPNLTIGGKTIDDDSDEDEEVPLAILAAHGFPNKNRQPSQLPSMSSNPNLRPGSGMGNNENLGAPNLPIFARNLPQDPYFGASVVNPLNRDPLAFRSGGSSHGGGYGGGGLVAVIEKEERARKARRGSPSNAAHGIGSNGMHHTGFGAMGMGQPPNMHPNPQMGQPMMNPMGMGMGPMGPMGQMNPMMMNPMMGAQGMTQDHMDFMRMQMQMFQMQQMQMMGMAPPQGPGSVNGGNQNQRTSTMTGNGAPTLQIPGIGPTPQRPQNSGRAMSLVDPNAAPWRNTMPNYTPSIAPSERSNVGLPGRYRPVSNATANNENHPSGQSVAGMGDQSRWSNGTNTAKGPSSLATTVKPSVKVVQKEEDEEDEEAAWKAMQAKREKKRGFWKDKKQDEDIKSMMARFD